MYRKPKNLLVGTYALKSVRISQRAFIFTTYSEPCFKGLHAKLALTKIAEAVVIKPKGYLRCICENMEKEVTRSLSVSSDIHRRYSLCYRLIKGSAMSINMNNTYTRTNLSGKSKGVRVLE